MKTGVRRILILDTDTRNGALVEGALSASGYWVASTDDVLFAAQRARDREADLLLVDMALHVIDAVPRWERRKTDPEPNLGEPPISDGYALLVPIEVEPAAARYPTVVLTDWSGAIERAPCRFGVVGYLPRPVPPQALRQKVQAAFRALRVADKLPPRPYAGTSSASAPAPLSMDAPLAELTVAIESGNTSASLAAPPFESLPGPFRVALLFDTDTGYRGYVRDLLEGQSFTVHEASAMADALRLAVEKRPFLILTDLHVPAATGLEFCKAVRTQSLIAHTPLLFLSSWDGYRERHHAMQLGADDYLSKAVSSRELLIRIQLVLKRYSDLRTRIRGTSMEGEVQTVGAPGVLQMCHLNQLSGVVVVKNGPRAAEIWFREGEVVSAQCGGASGAEAVYEFIGWSSGHFEFAAKYPGTSPPLARFEQLVLEGCRRLDEAKREFDDEDSGGDKVIAFRSGS